MPKIKSFVFNILKLTVAALIAAVILCGFCMVYNYTGCRVTNYDGATDCKWESNQFFSTMIEGFSWLRFDKNGYNNENDASFEEDPVDILLMGSSQMEAANVRTDENTGALLNRLLPRYRTYNIGISAHSIYQCVQNLPKAYERYRPTRYVIVETGTLDLGVESMNKALNGDYPKYLANDSGLVYYVQKTVPACKSLYKAVTDWKSASEWNGWGGASAGSAKKDTLSEYKETLTEFLQAAREAIPEECELIIFYQPPTELDSDGNFTGADSVEIREAFSEACESNDIVFVDLTENFESLYCEKHILGHGFANTAVGAGHLNKYGHRVIAEALANLIDEEEGTK